MPVVDLTSDSSESNLDLTHLLKIIDDELGLPPWLGAPCGGSGVAGVDGSGFAGLGLQLKAEIGEGRGLGVKW